MSLTSAAVAADAAVLAPAITWTGERLLASCSRSSLASLSDRTAQLGHGRSTGGGCWHPPWSVLLLLAGLEIDVDVPTAECSA